MYKGKIVDLRIVRRALTEEEIKRSYEKLKEGRDDTELEGISHKAG